MSLGKHYFSNRFGIVNKHKVYLNKKYSGLPEIDAEKIFSLSYRRRHGRFAGFVLFANVIASSFVFFLVFSQDESLNMFPVSGVIFLASVFVMMLGMAVYNYIGFHALVINDFDKESRIEVRIPIWQAQSGKQFYSAIEELLNRKKDFSKKKEMILAA